MDMQHSVEIGCREEERDYQQWVEELENELEDCPSPPVNIQSISKNTETCTLVYFKAKLFLDNNQLEQVVLTDAQRYNIMNACSCKRCNRVSFFYIIQVLKIEIF